jgi:DNA-binding transcriptional LysR family regulator
MEWQQIIGFYHVARLGNFTRAAEATFRTQSALSQQVKGLEEELGCLLIERIGRRKLRLTAAGEQFFRFAEGVVENYEVLTESLHNLQGIQKGTLSLAAPFTTLYHLFPEILQSYVAHCPEIRLTILDRSQKTVIGLVKNGDVDFGFVLESLAPPDLVVSRWKKVETVLMTPLGHPLAEEREVTFEAIVKYPLILNPRDLLHSNRLNVEERLQRLGLPYHVIMESSNVELSSLYVETGLGISFATIVRDLPNLRKRKLQFIPLDRHFDPDYLAVVARKNRRLASHKRAFLSLVLDKPSTETCDDETSALVSSSSLTIL